MDNTNTPTQPQTPNKDDVVKKWHESRISMTEEYDTGAVVIQVDGIPIGTLGNFSASIGKAKSKKTFNVSAMTAAALSGEKVLTYEVNLPEGKNKILYVDTEQSKAHCKKTLARILALANLSDGTDNDRLEFLSLRKYTPKERIEIIECALATTEGIGLVIIDGVRDLLFDINAPLEATQITSILMRWTDEYQIHIHTVLHQNKGDENARGHIGTEINNKAETIIKVEKDKADENISKVSAVLTRAQTFPTFAFRINDHILPELIEDYVSEPKKAGRPSKKEFDPYFDITQEQHEAALEKIFPTMFDEFNYEDLQNKLVEELRTILAASIRTRQQRKSLFSGTKEWLYRITGNSTDTIGEATATEYAYYLRLLYFIQGAYIGIKISKVAITQEPRILVEIHCVESE